MCVATVFMLAPCCCCTGAPRVDKGEQLFSRLGPLGEENYREEKDIIENLMKGLFEKVLFGVLETVS